MGRSSSEPLRCRRKISRRVLCVAGGLAGVVAVGLLAGYLLLTGFFNVLTGHTSDDAMIEKFRQHQQDFETLRHMVIADKQVDRIALDWTRPEDPQAMGVTAGRLEEYRTILRRLDLPLGVQGVPGRTDSFEVLGSGIGWFNRGSGKSYVWKAVPPTTGEDVAMATNIDAFIKNRQTLKNDGRPLPKHIEVFRPINGNWYLYYDD